MTGLLMLVLAEIADTATSVVDMASGRGVEANPVMPHDMQGFLFVKVAVVLSAATVYLLAQRFPKGLRDDIDAVFAFCAGVLCLVAFHNLGIAQTA